jgi:protein involved in polysaccharide export with SLBB domain
MGPTRRTYQNSTLALRLGAALGALVLTSACPAQKPFVWVNDLPVAASAERLIEPRDVLFVDVRGQKELSGEFPVRDDGSFNQPSVGSVRAAGLTTHQVAASLRQSLEGVIVNAQVNISISKPAPIKVNVVGQVKTPGSFELTRDRSVTAALAAAGWLNEFAGDDDVYVLRSGQQDPREARVRFRVRDLTSAEIHSIRFQLRDGDVVVAE